jgi:hypothetical protein
MGKRIIAFVAVTAFLVMTAYFFRYLFVMSWLCNAKIDYTIVPLDVFSLLISSAITVWIGWYVAKKLTEQRFEKDFLISDLKQMEEEVHQIKRLFDSSSSIDVSHVALRISLLHQIKQKFCATYRLVANNISADELGKSINELFSLTTTSDSKTIIVDHIDAHELAQKINNIIINIRRLIVKVNQR